MAAAGDPAEVAAVPAAASFEEFFRSEYARVVGLSNRRVNAVLQRMAVTQLRCDERARRIYDDARRRGHTKREALRILKRHLSDVVYRKMIRDQTNRTRQTGHEQHAA